MNLKHKLTAHYLENEADYCKEETFNTLQILAGYDDTLNGLSKNDATLLLRLIDDTELDELVEELIPVEKNKDPFA